MVRFHGGYYLLIISIGLLLLVVYSTSTMRTPFWNPASVNACITSPLSNISSVKFTTFELGWRMISYSSEIEKGLGLIEYVDWVDREGHDIKRFA